MLRVPTVALRLTVSLRTPRDHSFVPLYIASALQAARAARTTTRGLAAQATCCVVRLPPAADLLR
jgi:hypothetical protein